jgi:cytochrome c biogenesis protein CcmG, thiol:disulfide interchange protein DsbE
MAASSSGLAPAGEPGVVHGKFRRAGLYVGLALAIVLGAWYIGGQQNFGSIGKAGMNTQLLPKVGTEAPNFTVTDLLGHKVSLSDFKGQPVWLTFWGSWCPPCRAEMPDMVEAYKELQPKGVVMLAISLDEPAINATSFAALNHATFVAYSDPDRSATGASYPILNFPTHIFIGKDGKVKELILKSMSVEEAVGYGNEIANS